MALAVLLAAAGCRGTPRDPLVTYFNADQLLSVRYPASWRSEDGTTPDGVWYRHFQGPPNTSNTITVTVLSGATAGTLDQYAQSYIGANTVSSSSSFAVTDPASGQEVAGKRWRYATPDRARRFGLLLLQQGGRVCGLSAQGPAAAFEEHERVVDEMEKSLTLERPAAYPERRQDKQGFAIRVPASWTEGQNFSTGATYLMQFLSPALSADKRQTMHASLTVNVEPLPAGVTTAEGFANSVRQRLGEAYKVLTELDWRGGRVVMARVETPLAVSRAKRYFWVSGPRGYSVACEGREDVFPRVTRWCDVIVSTLQIGGQPLPAEAPAPVASASPSPSPRPLIAR